MKYVLQTGVVFTLLVSIVFKKMISLTVINYIKIPTKARFIIVVIVDQDFCLLCFTVHS